MTNKMTVQQTKSGLACTGKDKDKPDLTINNFLIVMLSDAKYVGVKFNELRGVGEWHRIDKNGKLIIRTWTDADEAESMRYIEENYKKPLTLGELSAHLGYDYCYLSKAFKKLLPTVDRYPNDIIVTVDDDIYYPYQFSHLCFY